MSVNGRSDFVDLIIPLGERLKLYDPTKQPSDQSKNDAADSVKAIPQAFIDAMTVRATVFVDEQKVPLENEFDEDDERSFHWVAYASLPIKSSSSVAPTTNSSSTRRTSASTKFPIGTIRLVPPPHKPHTPSQSSRKPETADPAVNSTVRRDSIHSRANREPYIKLGRLAVIPEYRKAGVSRLLIETALAFAKEHPTVFQPHFDPTRVEAFRQQEALSVLALIEWKGLVLVHSQTGVQKVWKRYGFETDASMGEWDEEGIGHVGMWKRVDVGDGREKRRGSKMLEA